MKYFFLFLWMCTSIFSQEKPLKYVDFFSINAIDFSVFENPKFREHYAKTGNKNAFLKSYFAVWNTRNQSVSNNEIIEFFSYKDMVKNTPCIGENYDELANKIVLAIKQNIAIDKHKIGKNIQLGITLKTTNIRVFPTNEFCFKNVRNAGEGYPFDYFQNSTLWAAAPVSILAVSNDKLWYFINSHNNKGWVKASEIALITLEEAQQIQQLNFLTPINDNIVVNGKFSSSKVFLGSVFPSKKINGNQYILFPKKNKKNYVYFEPILITNKNFASFPISFSAKNVKHILNELLHHKYTWGGLNEGRDCSSTLKDFFTPFGLWLPRNSKQQKNARNKLTLQGSNKDKITSILNNGIPFLSTIYKPGHIVLYLGKSKNGTPIVFQNVWGIKAYYKHKKLNEFASKKTRYGLFGIHSKNNIVNTRFIIGKAVITNIEPSKKLDNFKNLSTESFLNNFTTLTNF